jgi:hypothetical protein
MPRVALILFVLAPFFATPSFAKIVQVTWPQPTQNTDGTALAAKDITGNRIVWGTCSGSSITPVGQHMLGPSTADSIDLPAGTWCIVATAITAKGESAPTNNASVTVVVEPVCPSAPASETRQQVCPAPTIGSYTQTHGWTSVAAPACWTPDAWAPVTPPAGMCATALVTADTKAYELRSATLPLAWVGLVRVGAPCGPETIVRNGVTYCRVTMWRPDGALQMAPVVWPQNASGTDYWVKASP